jgi:hypothetical protein
MHSIDPKPTISNDETATCPVCSKPFPAREPWMRQQQVYCSPRCRRVASTRRMRDRKRARASIPTMTRLIAEKIARDGTQTVSIDFEGPVIYWQTQWVGADVPNHRWVEVVQHPAARQKLERMRRRVNAEPDPVAAIHRLMAAAAH